MSTKLLRNDPAPRGKEAEESAGQEEQDERNPYFDLELPNTHTRIKVSTFDFDFRRKEKEASQEGGLRMDFDFEEMIGRQWRNSLWEGTTYIHPLSEKEARELPLKELNIKDFIYRNIEGETEP